MLFSDSLAFSASIPLFFIKNYHLGDGFGPKQKINEPVTSGLNIGPGPGPAVPPENNVNDLLYQMYALTGDTALLQLVDFD